MDERVARTRASRGKMALGLALEAAIRALGLGGGGVLQPPPSSDEEAPSLSELIQLLAGSGSSWTLDGGPQFLATCMLEAARYSLPRGPLMRAVYNTATCFIGTSKQEAETEK